MPHSKWREKVHDILLIVMRHFRGFVIPSRCFSLLQKSIIGTIYMSSRLQLCKKASAAMFFYQQATEAK